MKQVSVVMATYNEKKIWIKQAIDSILNQTYRDFEFIIVLDNPNNIELRELLEWYRKKDKRIIVLINKENIGLVKSLNNAIKVSKGKYIVRMDADDISKINRIEKQIEFMNKENIDILGANIDCINESGDITHKQVLKKYNERIQLLKNTLVHPTLIYRKSLLDEIGLYKEATYAEDYELLIRAICFKKKLGMMDEVLLEYRVRENSVTRLKTIEQMKTVDYIQEKYREYKIKSIYTFSEKELKRKLDEFELNGTKAKLEKINYEKNSFIRIIKKIKFVKKNYEYKNMLILNSLKIKLLEKYN